MCLAVVTLERIQKHRYWMTRRVDNEAPKQKNAPIRTAVDQMMEVGTNNTLKRPQNIHVVCDNAAAEQEVVTTPEDREERGVQLAERRGRPERTNQTHPQCRNFTLAAQDIWIRPKNKMMKKQLPGGQPVDNADGILAYRILL